MGINLLFKNCFRQEKANEQNGQYDKNIEDYPI
jgi:hypothetical protein